VSGSKRVNISELARLASDRFRLGSLLAAASELTLKLNNEVSVQRFAVFRSGARWQCLHTIPLFLSPSLFRKGNVAWIAGRS
jgi:hypothetical protein